MKKIILSLLSLLFIPILLFAQTKYNYVIVPEGTDPNTLGSGLTVVPLNGNGLTNFLWADKNGTDQGPLTDTAFTLVTFTNEVRDSFGWYNPSNGTCTVKRAGLYLFAAAGIAQAGTYGAMHLYINGARKRTASAGQSSTAYVNNLGDIFAPIELQSNDEVSVYCQLYNVTPNSGVLSGHKTNTYFAGYLFTDVVTNLNVVPGGQNLNAVTGLVSTAGGTSLVYGVAGNVATNKGLKSGTNVILSDDGTNVTINAGLNVFYVNKYGTDQASAGVGVWTLLSYTNIVNDTLSGWNVTSNAYQILRSGYYVFKLTQALSVAETMNIAIYTNNVAAFYNFQQYQGYPLTTPECYYPSGTWITAYGCLFGSGAGAAWEGDIKYTWFSGEQTK